MNASKEGRNMAIAVEVSFSGPGATPQNYLSSLEKMGAAPEGPHPDTGCLFHWITEVPGGLKVTDVWLARDEFERFAQEKIGPVSAETGLPQPQVNFIDVANYLTAG
ncbi:MAG: hypothetical protein ACXVRH_11350 [Thermoleophilaceae bacterium]